MEFLFKLYAGIAFLAPPTPAGWVVWLALLGAPTSLRGRDMSGDFLLPF